MNRTANLLLAAAALLVPHQAITAQHPAVSGFYHEEDWVTLADFRHVTSVAAGDENAYVGTAGGVEVLDPTAGLWSRTVTAGDGLPSSVVTAVAYDPVRGAVWIGTLQGLAIYEPFRGEVVQDPLRIGPARVREIRIGPRRLSRGPAPVPEGIRGTAEERPGSTAGDGSTSDPQAFVQADGRWYRSDPFTWRTEPVSASEVPPPEPALDLARVPFLRADAIRVERSGRVESFRITDAEALTNGRVVLGSWGSNAHLYDPVRLETRALPFGLAGPGGGAIGSDGERLWFTNAPASRFVAGRAAPRAVEDRDAIASASVELEDWVHSYPGYEAALPSDRVHAIGRLGRRALFATDRGLGVFDAAGGRWLRVRGPVDLGEEIFSVVAAADVVWIGTRRGVVALEGLASGVGASGASDESALDSLRVVGRWLENRSVTSLAADRRELYVGTDLGLFKLAAPSAAAPAAVAPGETGPRSAAATPTDAAPAQNWVLSSVATSGREIRDLALLDQEVVVATERGLELLPRRGGEPVVFLVGEGPLDDAPLAVAADRENLWVGTERGVSRWERLRRLWTDYGLADGIPELPVLDVFVQDQRYVWFSTPGGATRFDFTARGGG